MRYLVISDIHGNFHALEAVLSDSAGNWDRVLCLGDLVGYGPQPNECVDRLAELSATTVPGNHDWAAIGLLPLDFFNRYARAALEWTQPRLSDASRSYLSGLKPLALVDIITLFHGSLTNPLIDYILDDSDAKASFRLLESVVGLFGHSHLRFYFSRGPGGEIVTHPLRRRNRVDLRRRTTLLNPGSVGQPRDGDPRAAYGILDTDTGLWYFRRIRYDISAVQQLMRRHGLPELLVDRLTEGR